MPTSLLVIASPPDAVAGTTLGAVVISVRDAQGKLIADATNPITVGIVSANPGATLSGTLQRSAVGGVATFPDLAIQKAGSGYKLSATATGLAEATTSSFTIAPAAPSISSFAVQPVSVGAGQPIAPGIKVVLRDSFGNDATQSTTSITLAIAEGTGAAGAVLGGTKTRAAVAGVATFDDITVNKVGAAYTLTTSAPEITSATSGGFNVTPGPPSVAVFMAEPASSTAGQSIAPQIQVLLRDAFGNDATQSTASVVLAIAAGSGSAGASLGGTKTRAAVAGLATFDDITIDKVSSSYQLTASSSGVSPVTSGTFAISPGAPATTAFIVQPPAAVAGVPLAPAITVALRDAFGNDATQSTASVTIAIAAGTGAAGATLGGTTTRAAVAGVATFTGLTVDKVASTYRLAAAGTGMSAATSVSFAITPAAPATAVFINQPVSGMAGVVNGSPITVGLRDAFGNDATQSTAPVTLAISGGTGTAGTVLTGTLTRPAVGGVATFDDVVLDRAGTSYTLAATAGGISSGTSAAFSTDMFLRHIAGWGQPGIAGYLLADTLRVRVENPVGTAVVGANVSWTPTAGIVASATTTTNALGEAYSTWVVGPGEVVMTARTGAAGVAEFGATGRAPASCTFTGGQYTSFPPLPDSRKQPTNRTLRVAALFVDFPDGPATKTVAEMMTEMVAPAQARLAATSGNRIQLEVVPSANWKRMSENMADLRPTDFLKHRDYIDTVLARFDPEYDFSTIDFVWIFRSVAADPMTGSGSMNLNVNDFWKLPTRDGRELHNYTTFGGDIYYPGVDHGARIVAHETGHVLLLPDQYAYVSAPGEDGIRFSGGWSFMGLAWPGTAWTAAEQLYTDVLPAADVLCPPEQSFGMIATIQPLLSASGLRAIGLRTSTSALTFMEVRQKIGMDAGICSTGLLIYDVDGNKAGGDGSIVVREGRDSPAGPEKTACETKWNAPYRVGDTFNLSTPNVWIDVLSLGGDGSMTVRITRP